VNHFQTGRVGGRILSVIFTPRRSMKLSTILFQICAPNLRDHGAPEAICLGERSTKIRLSFIIKIKMINICINYLYISELLFFITFLF
jgi:hypothetical protein